MGRTWLDVAGTAKTLIVGEPGSTGEGRRYNMRALLDAAHACGADVFKPQWTSDPRAMCERRNIGHDHAQRGYYEHAYGWLNFPTFWHQEFRDACHRLGLKYACSVYLPQDIATVAPYVDYLKISSFEALDASMFQELLRLELYDLPVLVSTGTQGPRLMWWEQWKDLNIKRLHCVSAYPAPIDALNLRTIRDVDGYSDHSDPSFTWVGALAVAAGAEFIEAHYRLDDCDPDNPDYAVARTPRQFEDYIRHIRFAEACLGDGAKKRQPCEEWAVPYRVVSA